MAGPTWDNIVAIDGLLEPETGQILTAALEPLARPHSAHEPRSGGQRRADALAKLTRRALEADRLPYTGGVRPQLTVTVDLTASSATREHSEEGSAGPDHWTPRPAQRLACDSAVTRVLVTHHPSHHPSGQPPPQAHDPSTDPSTEQQPVLHDPSGDQQPVGTDHDDLAGLATRLRAATALLPPPSQAPQPGQPGPAVPSPPPSRA